MLVGCLGFTSSRHHTEHPNPYHALKGSIKGGRVGLTFQVAYLWILFHKGTQVRVQVMSFEAQSEDAGLCAVSESGNLQNPSSLFLSHIEPEFRWRERERYVSALVGNMVSCFGCCGAAEEKSKLSMFSVRCNINVTSSLYL
jgi:hypothetical protein